MEMLTRVVLEDIFKHSDIRSIFRTRCTARHSIPSVRNLPNRLEIFNQMRLWRTPSGIRQNLEGFYPIYFSRDEWQNPPALLEWPCRYGSTSISPDV